MVSAPRNVDDADTIEPYALEKQFNVHSEGDSDYFYYTSEGNYILEEEAGEGEVTPRGAP